MYLFRQLDVQAYLDSWTFIEKPTLTDNKQSQVVKLYKNWVYQLLYFKKIVHRNRWNKE